MGNNIAIISDSIPLVCSKLKQIGYKLIYTESVDGFISYEKKHADMQCISVNNTVFVLRECKTLGESIRNSGVNVIYTKCKASGTYPDNVLLNAKIIGKYVIGKTEALDDNFRKYCDENGFEFINVKQGYSGCSCLRVNDNSVITSDPSIYKALKEYKDISVLKISEGYIKLFGADNTYGFIGGTSMTLSENSILFFGDITKHPDYRALKEFCLERNVYIEYINDIELTDIGGSVLLNN